MKYSFMSFSCPRLTLDEMLALARRLGYDGIEPRLAVQHAHGIEVDANPGQRREIRQKVADSGIALACLATSCSYADPQRVWEQVQETRRCIDLAADVNCPRLRVFGGSLPPDVTRGQAIDLLTEALLVVGEQARACGVTLCLETHDDWTDPEHVAEVMRRVHSPAVAVNWDVMHPVRQSQVTMDQAFQVLRPWIRHVHFHDGLNTLAETVLKPVGQGDFDHRRVVKLLKAAAYDGYLSGEWIGWEPYEVHLPRELATMRSYER